MQNVGTEIPCNRGLVLDCMPFSVYRTRADVQSQLATSARQGCGHTFLTLRIWPLRRSIDQIHVRPRSGTGWLESD